MRNTGDNRPCYTMYRWVTAPEWRQLVAPFARPGRQFRTKDIPVELRIVRWALLPVSEAGWLDAGPAT